jgi:molecular chaperone IbpA|tara:strand:- start:721 stop:1155 length:435 start_codon:yes stop_codon:yes gene_type:complete
MTSKNILDLNNRLYQTSYVGFDRLFDEFFRLQSSTKNVPNYPPYNLVKDGDSYTIEMAMAGLTDKDVDVVLEDRTLSITYEKSEVEDDEGVIHKGLAQRSFKRSFNLADDIEVQKAQLKNGLLSIRMERIVPDEKKPQKIKLSK